MKQFGYLARGPRSGALRLRFLLLLGLAVAACGGSKPVVPSTLVINEVVASNQAGCADEQGERDDWIELYNKGDDDVSLEGYYVTDDPASPLKTQLGTGLVVPAKGVLVLWADKAPEQGAAHLPFKLDAQGEAVQLRDPGAQLVDQLTFQAVVSDHSFARFPDGEGALVDCAAPTCRALNGASCGSP